MKKFIALWQREYSQGFVFIDADNENSAAVKFTTNAHGSYECGKLIKLIITPLNSCYKVPIEKYYHSRDCGTKYRGCSPDCPVWQRQIEEEENES